MAFHLRSYIRKLIQDYRYPPYTAWLHASLSDVCNLECHYCISDSPGFSVPKTLGGKTDPAKIEEFLGSLEKTAHIYKIIFTGGGEPFVIPNIVELCKAVTKKHYIGFSTNLTVKKRIQEFAEVIDPNRVANIHASLHIEELERKKLTDTFIDSYKLLEGKGFSISACIVAHPDLLERTEDIRSSFAARGVEVNFLSFIGEHEGKNYPRDYTQEQRDVFQLIDSPEPFSPKGKLCNAGFNVAMVDPRGGVHVCGEIQDSLGSIYDGFEFRDAPMICPKEKCDCPYFYFDQRLFDIAIEAAKKKTL